MPALDRIKHTFFLLALGRESSYCLARNDRFASRWIYDAGKDCATVASERCRKLCHILTPDEITYTADMMPPSVYILAAICCRPLASG